MGYGARLSFGCNIGEFIASVISTSAHGWVWFAAAMAGTAPRARLRPRFGLPVWAHSSMHREQTR
jgi:hypothetical protein